MKKAKKFLLLSMFISILTPLTSNATELDEPFLVNSNGVEMTETDYNRLIEHYSEGIVDSLPQEIYDILLEDINSLQKVDSIEMYVRTTTYQDPMGNVSYNEEIITEDEFNNFVAIQPMSNCNDGHACWETNAKKLTFTVYEVINSYLYMFQTRNTWKSIPKAKSFDVIANRWTTTSDSFKMTLYRGYQYADNLTQEYGYDGNNSKYNSNGVGISMNIIDDTSSILQNELIVYGYFEKATTFNIFATYQHATSDLTLNQSKSYSFSNSGLGNVLYYSNSTIRNAYDGMTGVNCSFVPTRFYEESWV